MPLLVRIGGWLAGISVVLSLVGVLAGRLPVAAATDLERYAVTAINIVLLGIVVGLILRRPWSRPLMIVFWILMILADFAAFPGKRPGAKELGCTGIIGLGCAVAYLYVKSNVGEYFDSLKSAPKSVASGRTT